MSPVAAIRATTLVPGLQANAKSAVKARVGPARISKGFALVAAVAGTTQTEERRTVRTLPAGTTVLARIFRASVPAFHFAVPAVLGRRANAVEVETLTATLTAGFAGVGLARVLAFVAVLAGETVGTLAVVFMHDQGRSEDNVLTVGDFSIAFDADFFGADTSVLASVVVAGRETDFHVGGLEEAHDAFAFFG